MTAVPLARIHSPDLIKVDELPLPTTGPQDVLVQVKRCGICGSDLSYAKLGGIPGAASPFAIGHEFSGIVVETGTHVTQVKPGDRVVVNPEQGDNGIGSAGHWGAFSPYVLYRNAVDYPQGILPLPAELDFDTGALVEPLAVGMHAVNQAAVGVGERVTVFGAGPVGLAAATAARYQGADDVVVIDLSEKRLAVAKEMGFIPCHAGQQEVSDFLKKQHGVIGNNPLLGEQAGGEIYIEATGVGAVFQQITEIARKGARIVVVGVHFAPVELNMINLLMRELVITASYAYPEEFPQVLEMLTSGLVDVSPMISHHFPLSQFSAAFEQAQRQDEAVKVMVNCQD